MSDSLTLKIVDGIGDKLSDMLERANQNADGFLNSYAYNRIIQMQYSRWQTENDGQWEPLKSEKYRAYKSKKFASFPGSGTKLMIASNQLYRVVVGEDTRYHRKLVQDGHLEIDIVVEPYSAKGRRRKRDREEAKKITGTEGEVLPSFTYAGFVNAKRNFTDVTDAALSDITAAYQAYITGDDQ